MNKLKRMKELLEENARLKEVHESDKRSLALIAERGVKLEKEISVLLSCKNCPNNKGGYICEKEYEGKCLSQKTQYIKELEEENTELKRDKEDLIFIRNQKAKYMCEDKEIISKAKEIIKLLLWDLRNRSYEPAKDIERAERFLGRT